MAKLEAELEPYADRIAELKSEIVNRDELIEHFKLNTNLTLKRERSTRYATSKNRTPRKEKSIYIPAISASGKNSKSTVMPTC